MTRGDELAAAVLAAADEVTGFARGLRPGEWEAVVPGEEWPVGVLVHHVAEGFYLCRGWVASLAAGRPVADTAEQIDADNAAHAQRVEGVGVDEAVAEVERAAAALAGLLRTLDDEALERTAPFGPAGGRPSSAGRMAEVGAAHARDHLAHARAALAAAS
jgi:hypothetical protein